MVQFVRLIRGWNMEMFVVIRDCNGTIHGQMGNCNLQKMFNVIPERWRHVYRLGSLRRCRLQSCFILSEMVLCCMSCQKTSQETYKSLNL